MGIFDSLFSPKAQNEQAINLLKNGAIIVDVRTPQEFQGGHVDGSLNFPLNSIAQEVNKLKGLNKEIIFCCASGNRSGQATKLMKAEGLICENGGSWKQVQRMLSA